MGKWPGIGRLWREMLFPYLLQQTFLKQTFPKIAQAPASAGTSVEKSRRAVHHVTRHLPNVLCRDPKVEMWCGETWDSWIYLDIPGPHRTQCPELPRHTLTQGCPDTHCSSHPCWSVKYFRQANSIQLEEPGSPVSAELPTVLLALQVATWHPPGMSTCDMLSVLLSRSLSAGQIITALEGRPQPLTRKE